MYVFNPTNALYFYPHRLRFEPAKETAERRQHHRWPSTPATSSGRPDIDPQGVREDHWDGEGVVDGRTELDEH